MKRFSITIARCIALLMAKAAHARVGRNDKIFISARVNGPPRSVERAE